MLISLKWLNQCFCILALVCFKTVFNLEEENELVMNIQLMEKMLFRLSSFELRTLSYELIVRNNKKLSFNDDLGVAGYDWYKDFMERHSKHLSLLKPEAASAARAVGFNQGAVDSFFSLLEEVVNTNKLHVENIWNCDEIGISSVPKTL